MNAYGDNGMDFGGMFAGFDGAGQFGQDIKNTAPSFLNALRKTKTSDLLEGLGSISRMNGDMSIGQGMDMAMGNPDLMNQLAEKGQGFINSYNQNYDDIYDMIDSGYSPSAMGDYFPNMKSEGFNGAPLVLTDAAADAADNMTSDIILNNSMDEDSLADFFRKAKGPGQLKWIF